MAPFKPKPPIPPSTAGLAAGVVAILSVPAVWYYPIWWLAGLTPSLSTALWCCIVWGAILCVIPMEKADD